MSRRWMVTWACWMAATILAWLAGSLSADERTEQRKALPETAGATEEAVP